MHLTSSPRCLLRLACAALAIAASVTVIVAGPARADDGFGWAACDADPATPGCDVGAQAPGSSGGTGTRAAGRAGSAGASQQCRNIRGQVVACHDPELGWLRTDGCYYRPTTEPSAELQAILDIKAGPGPGGWYAYVCPGLPGTGGGTQWIAGQPPGGAGVDPAVLARQAVSRLDLPQLRIGTSPAGTQLVTVPTWLWIDPGSWRPRSATAQVPGLTVTATATPSRVVWRTGDGATVTCTGPGTAWTPGTDPATPSPTCGHTYRRSSAGMPGGTFLVTATVSWTVAWAGGGQDGTVLGLSTTSTVTVRVTEVQAVVTR